MKRSLLNLLVYRINILRLSKNGFIHSGINNNRKTGYIVEECVEQLTSKLEKICDSCPYSKITVSPELPIKL